MPEPPPTPPERGVAVAEPPEPEVDERAHAELDRKIIRGSMWVALSYGGGQILSVVSMLVLVRLLEPSAFGVMSLAWTFLFIATTIQEGGAGAALIHRRGDDIPRAAASVLLFTPVTGIAIYGITFALAPFLANWFDAPGLTSVLRVLAIMVPLGSIGIVPFALLEREMRFRDISRVKLVAAVANFVAGISLAFAGAGVWSLVVAQLVASALTSALLWRATPWAPRPRDFDFGTLRQLLRYGRYVSASNLLNIAVTTLDNITVGRMLGTTPLGYYQIAFRISEFPNVVIGHIAGRTMFSAYASVQHDLAWVRRAYMQNLQRIALLALPASAGLLVLAEPLVLALLGEKWRATIAPLQILGAYGLVRSFAAPAGELYKGLGKPWINMVLGLVFAILIVPTVYVMARWEGLNGAALAMLVLELLAGIPAIGIAMRLVGLPLRELIHALSPSIMCTCLMSAALIVLTPETEGMHPVARLILLVLIGTVIYVATTAVFAREIVQPIIASMRRSRPGETSTT